MAGLQLSRVSLALTAQLPEHVFERHLPASPACVGDELAEAVHAYVMREHLGYYPALDFFQQQGGLDPALLNAADSISWFTASQVTEEVRRKLRPVFASLNSESVQTLAFTLPPVRPGQPNCLEQLARHYTPDTVKILLTVGIFQKRDNDQLARWATHLVYRWLKDSFESMEVTSAQQV